jgi:hypothetical protein
MVPLHIKMTGLALVFLYCVVEVITCVHRDNIRGGIGWMMAAFGWGALLVQLTESLR